MLSNDILAEKHPVKGILIGLIAYCFISLISLCVKSIPSTLPVSVILFFQNLVCLILILPSVIKSGINTFKIKDVNSYVVRIASGLGCYAAVFYLIRFVPVSEALLYQYSASLWIPLIMYIWFGARIQTNLWYGIIVGFLGMVIILKPTSSMWGIISIVGISCGLLQGISVVAIRRLSLTEPTLRILFYYFFAGFIVTAPSVIMNATSIAFIDMVWLVAAGICTYIAQWLFINALKYANAATLAPICYSSIIFSGVLSWLWWNEVPATSTLLGMMVVISGCLLTLYTSSKQPVVEAT